jgi:uncharacterized protein
MRSSDKLTIEYDIPAPMRDGIILRANICRPAGEGQWPVLLVRTPYDKNFTGAGTLSILDPVATARHGYVVVVQDVRGRYTSEGEWCVPPHLEVQDGYDTIAWAANLPYSDGNVGMFGASHDGFLAWTTATLQPPALKAIVPFVTWSDPLQGVLFRDGAFELGNMANWHAIIGSNILMRRYQHDPLMLGQTMSNYLHEWDLLGPEGYWSLPLKHFGLFRRTEAASSFFELLERPMDSAWASPLAIKGKHEQITVPTLNISGWYDLFLQGTLENFQTMRQYGSTPQARQSQLLIGPWTHDRRVSPIGEQHFGLDATTAFDFHGVQVRWFDRWLKGIATSREQEAPVRLFVMGENRWRDEQEWPLSRAVETCYYLHSAGHANTLHGDGVLSTIPPEEENPDCYTYDPANPVMTRGGAALITPQYPGGPFDQRSTEEREDVLVYSTAPLEQDVEATGPIHIRLWAMSSATDTDFVARLVDVHPDGYARNLTDGIIRARYRCFARGKITPSLLEPGQAYEYEINLWATSNLFKKGHRIRLDITSSNFPRWDRNPNTGHDFGADDELVVAHQTILHDAAHLSHVVLPLIPAQ